MNTRRPLAQRLAQALLTNDKHQRIRLGMVALSAVLMACCLLIVNVAVFVGLVEPTPVRWWTAFCGAGLVLVYALVRSGWSLRCKDPSLALAQVVYAVTCTAVGYAIAGPVRGVAPSILGLIMMFGIFGLSTRQMAGVALYGMAAFVVASVVVVWQDASPHTQLVSAAYAAMIAVVLVGSTFLTVRVQAIRQHMQQQKREVAQALARNRELATRDDLTGLLNRRAMLEHMLAEEQRCARSGQAQQIAMLDIDHFKAINDAHGHAAGDAVLKAFTEVVRSQVRTTDLLARWGGEEFVLMLYCAQETHPEHALALLERVRKAVQAHTIPWGGEHLRVTVSIGLATQAGRETAEQTLARADAALYAAKAAGRNRVEQAPPPEVAPALNAPA